MHNYLKKNETSFISYDIHLGAIYSSPRCIIYSRYIIFAVIQVREIIRESHERLKGSMVSCSHGRHFPLSCTPSAFVPTITSPRFVSRTPIRPCSQSVHRPSLPLNAHLTTTGITGDDNTDKGGLSRVKVREFS